MSDAAPVYTKGYSPFQFQQLQFSRSSCLVSLGNHSEDHDSPTYGFSQRALERGTFKFLYELQQGSAQVVLEGKDTVEGPWQLLAGPLSANTVSEVELAPYVRATVREAHGAWLSLTSTLHGLRVVNC